ncbi:MAG: hypothetical protein ACJ762_16395 [Solirubrobacteraceae bacterium]
MLALLILAQGRGEHETGGPLPGIAIIVGTLLLVALAGYLLFKYMARSSRASKGGVQPPASDSAQRHPGAPPLESIERRS